MIEENVQVCVLNHFRCRALLYICKIVLLFINSPLHACTPTLQVPCPSSLPLPACFLPLAPALSACVKLAEFSKSCLHKHPKRVIDWSSGELPVSTEMKSVLPPPRCPQTNLEFQYSKCKQEDCHEFRLPWHK